MSAGRIETGVYNGAGGKSVERTLADVNRLFTTETISDPLGTVDHLIATQIRAARSQNRNSITVLDLGSGEGRMLQNIISYPEQMPNTVSILQELKESGFDFAINLVGLTDTENLLNSPPVDGITYPTPANVFNGSVKATNYAYAITEAQPLALFLQMHNIDKLDLIISAETLMYFVPSVFKSTLSDIGEALVPGGRCVILGYKNFGGDILSKSDTRRPRILPDSWEDLKNRGFHLVMSGNEQTDEAVQFYEKLLGLWVKASNDAIDSYTRITEEKRGISDKALGSFILLLNQLHKYEAGERPSLWELSMVNITELRRLLHEIDRVYVREEKERIVEEFEREHSHARVIKGSYLLSITNTSVS